MPLIDIYVPMVSRIQQRSITGVRQWFISMNLELQKGEKGISQSVTFDLMEVDAISMSVRMDWILIYQMIQQRQHALLLAVLLVLL